MKNNIGTVLFYLHMNQSNWKIIMSFQSILEKKFILHANPDINNIEHNMTPRELYGTLRGVRRFDTQVLWKQ